MKTLAMWKDKHKLGFSLGANVLTLLGMILWMRPGIGSESSLLWETMASDWESAVVHQNHLLRSLYGVLQNAWGKVPWYALIQYVFLLAAFTSVIYVILEQLDNSMGWVVSFLFLVLFGYECYIRMNHTKTAAVLIGAGMMTALYGAVKEQVCKRSVAVGWVLICVGAMYRMEPFGVGVLLILGLCLYLLLEKRVSFLRLLCTMGVPVLLVSGLLAVNGKLGAKDQEWQQKREFYTVRDHLMDYGVPEYEQNKELYKELGIDKKTYKKYTKGSKEFYNEQPLETMLTLKEAKPMEQLSKALVLLFLRKFLVCCTRSRTFLCFLLLAVFWICWGKKKKTALLAAFYEAMMLGGMYFCLFYRMRNASSEHDMALWFFLSLILVWFLRDREVKLEKSAWLALCLSVLIVVQKDWFGDWRIRAQKGQEKYYHAFDVTKEKMDNPPVIGGEEK